MNLNFLWYGDKYVLQNNAEVTITGRSIRASEKIDRNTNTKTTITKYSSDPNPTTKTHIYATKSEKPGHGHEDKKTTYEKFLLAYNHNSYARNQLNSIDHWLYEMMEKRESTVELVDIVKYLLYMYDGKDTGVTKLDDFDTIFNPEDMTSFSDGIYGDTIQEKVWFTLVEQGYSEISVAGIMGNIDGESGFRPGAIEGNGEGYGLCQWSFGRKTKLINYAKSKGKEWKDEDIQIEFLMKEIKKGSSYFQMSGTHYGYTYDSWRNAKSVEEATKAFMAVFERPNMTVAHTEGRVSAAEKYYKQFHGKQRTGGIGGVGGKRVVDGHTLSKDGYNSVFKVGTRTFKNFQQWTGPWAGKPFVHSSSGGQTISQYGCSVSSVAIVASAFGQNITPATVADRVAKDFYSVGQTTYVTKLLSEYTGMKTSWKSFNKSEVIKQLKEGNPVVLLRDGSHWWVVLSISSDGKKAYVSDPGDQYRQWENIDSAMNDSQGNRGKATNYVKLSK